MKSFPLLLLPLLLVTIYSALGAITIGEAAGKTYPGDWEPININNGNVKDIAKFAVAQHDKKYKAKLQLSRVLKAEYQAVASGIDYKLILEILDGRAKVKYEAIVLEKAFLWEKSRELKYFLPDTGLKM